MKNAIQVNIFLIQVHMSLCGRAGLCNAVLSHEILEI